MRALCKDFALAFVMGFLLPGFLLGAAVLFGEKNSVSSEMLEETTVFRSSIRYEIRLKQGEATINADLDDYLVRVVLAEMPASFEPEALKAQAIAARTYTWKAFETGGKHGDGSVCTEPGCCQAYITEADYLAGGGTEEGIRKIRHAVEETSGLVLVYDGELIDATYFSCSGGSTEDAREVWGTEYPYLKAVDSPGEEKARYYRDTVSIPAEELAERLDLKIETEAEHWITAITYTFAGSVRTMVIGEKVFSGTEVRALLGLRSAAFTVEVSDGIFFITTKGYGHRVGMSQYGADAMAVKGSSYAEILNHYFPGTELVHMEARRRQGS